MNVNIKPKSPEIIKAADKLLKHARDLVAAGWTRKAYARSAGNRKSVNVNSAEACHFCTSGALMRAAQDLGYNANRSPILREAANRIALIMGEEYIKVNDNRHTKQEDVVMAFDLAALGAGASPVRK